MCLSVSLCVSFALAFLATSLGKVLTDRDETLDFRGMLSYMRHCVVFILVAIRQPGYRPKIMRSTGFGYAVRKLEYYPILMKCQGIFPNTTTRATSAIDFVPGRSIRFNDNLLNVFLYPSHKQNRSHREMTMPKLTGKFPFFLCMRNSRVSYHKHCRKKMFLERDTVR